MKPKTHTPVAMPMADDDAFIRLPGLFRRWELEQVLDPGNDFHFEPAGEAADGTALFAVYRRERPLNTTNPSKED